MQSTTCHMRRTVAVTAALLFLVSSAQSRDDAPPRPPQGWKEYAPGDKSFTVWVPERARRQRESQRTSTIRGQPFKVTSLHIEMAGGPIYDVEKLTLPLALHTRLNRKELEDSLKEMLLSEFRGKLTGESEAKLGATAGKEYLIETGRGLARARVFIGTGGRVVVLHVEGTKEQVQDKGVLVFLDSFRLGRGDAVADSTNSDKKDRTKIRGGGGDPEFENRAPEGGLLVGFEIGLGKFINNDVVSAGRAVYRVGAKDSFGMQYGTDMSRVVKVVAKQGYAVGAITVKTGAGVDGMSVTFMKISADGRLDPKDAYESEWIGGQGGRKVVRLGGDGTPVVGIIGKSNKKDMTGLGLLLKQ